MRTDWPRCGCGHTGWRYLTAEGSGWRCWCGKHRPDRPLAHAPVDVELPAGQLELFALTGRGVS